ncbi:hypothetical protein KIW84_052153 [Lathyrus oleraceus]|uniref:Uncharacterized protein n=1 Tax=Pisum sativum TaxID=3888 RepID=A0A9D4WP77_PEA|nr:hypothetical protein KIW84_052153 [Pisum sativum]
MDIKYASDELGSSDLDASDGDKEPKYPRFKMQDLDKNYKFKVGLKFVSLEEFKDAITEWVLNNSSATSKWVAKTVVARMTSSDGVKIRDIISEIRSKFSIGITMSRAWKAKQIAKSLIEVVALGFRNQCPKIFVDDYYSKDTYEKFYGYNRKPKKTTTGQGQPREQTQSKAQTATQEQTQPTKA